MRKLALLALCTAMTASAGTPDAHSRIYHARQKLSEPQFETKAINETKYVPIIVEITDDNTAPLDELGAIVFYNRNHLYLTCIPRDKIDVLPRDERIDSYSISKTSTQALDVARAVSGVDNVHIGTGLTTPYTGKDVVTGICDVGFDPRHANFKDRLVRWVIYDEEKGQRTTYDGYTNIITNGPETDDVTKTHATHVANILVGGAENMPYHGVAPGSELVVTTGKLSDVGILAGIEDVCAYARQNGRRAVVNISAGSYLGPHDGTDLVGRYLSALSTEAVICFSAGNFGQRQNSFRANLDEHPEGIGSLFFNIPGWDGLEVIGMSDLWGDDSRPFQTRIVIWDVTERRAVLYGPWLGGTAEAGQTEFILHDYVDKKSLQGGLWMAWGLDPSNGRYNVTLDYEYLACELQKAGPWARYFVGFQVRPTLPGTYVTAYADGIGSFFGSNGVANMVNGVGDGSISNLASCPDVIAVGAWNSRCEVPDVENTTYTWTSVDVDHVAKWSAYGTSGDKRPLPHFCAPGNTLVSALSRPHYYYDGPKDDADRTAWAVGEERWFAASGTSMASPFAAGVFALWLEADPTLSVTELRDIAIQTAKTTYPDISDPRWGAGAIDAHAGLVEIEKRAGIGNATDIQLLSSTKSSRPTWYTIDGRQLYAAPSKPGLYIKVNGTDAVTVVVNGQ